MNYGLGWAQGSMYYLMGPRSCMQSPGNYMGKDMPWACLMTLSHELCKNSWNRSICHFGCGGPKEAYLQSYSPGGANVPSWWIQLNSPSAAALWPVVIVVTAAAAVKCLTRCWCWCWGCAMSGLIADSRTLIDKARVEAQVCTGGTFVTLHPNWDLLVIAFVI